MLQSSQVKRIKSELLKDYNMKYEDAVFHIYNNRTSTRVSIYLEEKFIDVDIGMSWPFYPPNSVHINNRSVKFQYIPQRLLEQYREKFGNCPCCMCYIHGTTWNITRHIKEVIDQYEHTKKKMFIIYYKKWLFRFLPIFIPCDVEQVIQSYLC